MTVRSVFVQFVSTMKTKQQKSAEIERAGELLQGSKVLLYTDFSKISTEEVRKLRRDILAADGRLLVMKKRLLGVLMKREGHEFNSKSFPGPVGTVFSKNALDKIAGPIFKFFKELKLEGEKILGGYDLETKSVLSASQVIAIGQLPPREVLLGQLVGLLSSPIRSFLFVLDQKSKK